MVKHVSLFRLTDEGRQRQAHEAPQLFEQMVAISEGVGGKLLSTFALDGRYDFVAIEEYPSPEAAFEARIKVLELGICTVESFEAFDIDFYLAKV